MIGTTKNDELAKIIASGKATIVSIDPDIKTEISKKKIDGIIADMKKHLLRKKKVHIVLVRE